MATPVLWQILVLVISTCFVSVVRITATGSQTSEVREYCIKEYFNASCPNDNDVILMTSAQYGRMRLGRCIRGDYNLGCSNDVITIFDEHCSGRKSCDVSVRTLVDIRPCQRDFASYLEASYTCIKVLDLQMTSCPATGSDASPAAVALTSPVGYLSNTLYKAYSSLGRLDCPWIVRGEPGQRIELTLYTLHVPRPVATQGGTGADVSYAGCTKIVVSEGWVFDGSPPDGTSGTTGSSEFSLCVKRSRERRLYTSSGHVVAIYTMASSSTSGQTTLTQSPLTNNNNNNNNALGSETRFLLMYRLLGCPHLALSEKAWVRPIGSHGDDIMVRCNDTLETWYLSCQGNQWIGHYDNCTVDNVVPMGSTVKKQITSGFYQQSLTHGIALALGLGLVLGIFIAVISLCTICCVQHWCTSRQTADKGASELTVSVDGSGLYHPQWTRVEYDCCDDSRMAPSSSAAIYKPGILAGYNAALGGGGGCSVGGNRATRAAVIDYGNDEQINTKTPPSGRPLSTFGASQDPSGLIGMAFTGRHCTTQRSAVGRHSLSLKGSRHCTSSGSSMAEVTGDESEAVADSTRMQMFRRGSNPEDVVQNHGTDAVDNEETQEENAVVRENSENSEVDRLNQRRQSDQSALVATDSVNGPSSCSHRHHHHLHHHHRHQPHHVLHQQIMWGNHPHHVHHNQHQQQQQQQPNVCGNSGVGENDPYPCQPSYLAAVPSGKLKIERQLIAQRNQDDQLLSALSEARGNCSLRVENCDNFETDDAALRQRYPPGLRTPPM